MDRKLLLAILKVHDIPIDKAKVAEELSTEDQPCTSMAIQKRLQAIKTMIKDKTGGESTSKAKATPRKRSNTASADNEMPSKKGKVGKGHNAKAKALGEDEAGEQDTVKEEDEEGDIF